MLQHFSRKAIFLALVLGLACSVLPVAQTQAQHGKKRQPHAEQAEKQQSQADRAPKQQPQSDRAPKQQHTITAAQAAERAKAQYGGEVLKVTPSGKGYRVKLLTESGRVLTVAIQG
jgi:uncharacterized protein HemX